MAFWYKMMQSPVSELKLVATERGLTAILWENDDPKRVRFLPQVEDSTNVILLEAEKQLREYFSRRRQRFDLTPSTLSAPSSSAKSGRRWSPFRSVKRAATVKSRARWAVQPQSGPSGLPMVAIPSQLLPRAIGLSAPTAN